MSLAKYRKKRTASKTPEPFGGKSATKGKLIFVIQKHAASHLHYDFRLEMGGVLKSWAIPKGPSTDPSVKRLAMAVEDHPFDYRNFEGIIPKGQYGGGTVIVWDEGTYEASEPDDKNRKGEEKHLLHGLHAGMLKIELHGKKLKGSFALVKTRGRGENSWLLIKHKDKYAAATDITLKTKSVQSGKTLEQVAKSADKIWNSNRSGASGKPAKKSTRKPSKAVADKSHKELAAATDAEAEGVAVTQADVSEILKKAKKSRMPSGVKPMLATLVDRPFDDTDWRFEIKWDGYRAVSYLNKGTVNILSRNNKSFTEKYYPLVDLMSNWKFDAVLDGEIMVVDDRGVSQFGALQNWRSEADGELIMYVFDLLWYNGKDLMPLTLVERQAILKSILPTDDDRIRISESFEVKGTEFFESAVKLGLEGIMAKKADSAYALDIRSKEWLKIKANKRQEVVIAGFTKSDGTGKLFSSLLLGVHSGRAFRYVGKVGTGFNDKMQKEMMASFKPLITNKVPFDEEPDINKPSRFRPNPPHAKATWLLPKLVCEVSFTEITSDGVFRHPSFEGMRSDKKASSVVQEKEESMEKIAKKSKAAPAKKSTVRATKKAKAPNKLVKAAKDTGKKTLLNPTEDTQVKKVNGHELKFTNLSKIYWPDEKITKRDMLNYYYQVAEYINPYLKDRPQSLNRFPNGIKGMSFYQKDVKGKSPDWVDTFPYTTGEGERKQFLVAGDDATLLWMASLGCIEMNPWFSRVSKPNNPDYCVIDLDPDKKKTKFEQVITAAQKVKEILDEVKTPCYVKTSGSTGIHIYIPLNAKYSYDQSQLFARLVVSIVHQQLPDFTSMERSIKNRNGKMYLDFLQNRPGATIACPYSLRPKPGATVSMPLHWEEVKPGLKMADFTIKNAITRIRREGDIFKPVLGKGINLDAVVKKMEAMAKEGGE